MNLRNFNLPPGFTLRDIEPLTALHCDGCGADLRLDRAWTREKGGMALYDEFYCDACAGRLTAEPARRQTHPPHAPVRLEQKASPRSAAPSASPGTAGT